MAKTGVVEQGTEPVISAFVSLESRMPSIAAKALTKDMKFLESRMIKITPILTGMLRANFLVVPAQPASGGIVEGAIENLSPYAFEVHENPRHIGYGKGPISRIQPTQPEGRVGPKFMTRVIDFHRRDAEQRLGVNATPEILQIFRQQF